MTPQEKADELVLNYLRIDNDTNEWFHKGLAKKCALLAVDEVIKVCPYYSKEGCETIEQLRANDYEFITYWNQVKQEIEKL